MMVVFNAGRGVMHEIEMLAVGVVAPCFSQASLDRANTRLGLTMKLFEFVRYFGFSVFKKWNHWHDWLFLCLNKYICWLFATKYYKSTLFLVVAFWLSWIGKHNYIFSWSIQVLTPLLMGLFIIDRWVSLINQLKTIYCICLLLLLGLWFIKQIWNDDGFFRGETSLKIKSK